MADGAEVTRKHGVIVFKASSGVREVRRQRGMGGRRHGRAHVGDVVDPGVADHARRDVCDARSLSL